ncbi:hypothetical protein [Kribbella speibonae]|uniref:Uncharacterized protein n=1 Tax=Kribbella speibonae TaxID=1572660 RepID=A0ABY2AAT0_9ACTN|nr:hypothetical protein [Kribbella speibonae]TCC26809.1 hypothetical protein E0H58_01985 [Kribbella speibonae]
MTEQDSREMPHRPRVARIGLHTQWLLRSWGHIVKRVEVGFDEIATGRPHCDGTEGLDARDQLESLIRRGGKRAERISVQVTALDERFLRATSPQPFSPVDANWWRYRNLD